MKNNRAFSNGQAPTETDQAGQLTAFLLSLPSKPRRTRRYSRGDVNLCITGETAHRVSSVSRAIARMFPDEKEPHSFRIETLVYYLLNKFLDEHQTGVETLMARLAADDYQDQLNAQARLAAAINSLLD